MYSNAFYQYLFYHTCYRCIFGPRKRFIPQECIERVKGTEGEGNIKKSEDDSTQDEERTGLEGKGTERTRKGDEEGNIEMRMKDDDDQRYHVIHHSFHSSE